MSETLNQILIMTSNLFIIYLIGYSIFSLTFIMKGIKRNLKYRHQKKLNNRLKKDLYIPISIILVTHNDEMKIEKKIESLLNLNYNLYEIIIVDDGSQDKTTDIIIGAYELKKVNRPIHKVIPTKENKSIFESNDKKVKITLIKKEQYGKSDAFNTGINASEYPYVICMDSNYNLLPNALEYLVHPVLEDDNVIISTSSVQIGNLKSYELENRYEFPSSILPKLQVLEYNRKNISKNLEQNDLFLFPTLTLLKKDMVQACLGFDEHTMGENFEIIRNMMCYSSLQKDNSVIKNVYDTTGFYEPPYSLKKLLKQRHLWRVALKRSLRNHRHLKRKNHVLISLFQFFYVKCFKLIKLIGLLSIIIACSYGLLKWEQMLLFFISYILFFSCISLCSLTINLKKEEITISIKNLIIAMILSVLEIVLFELIFI